MYNLYILETCPYCRKVTDFLDKNAIQYHKFYISNAANKEKLISIGGKEQVPFLYDEENDVKMYESEDIIKYLSGNNYAKQ